MELMSILSLLLSTGSWVAVDSVAHSDPITMPSPLMQKGWKNPQGF